jgi:hypothetical protein
VKLDAQNGNYFDDIIIPRVNFRPGILLAVRRRPQSNQSQIGLRHTGGKVLDRGISLNFIAFFRIKWQNKNHWSRTILSVSFFS